MAEYSQTNLTWNYTIGIIYKCLMLPHNFGALKEGFNKSGRKKFEVEFEMVKEW